MSNRKLVVANWKMNPVSLKDAEKLLKNSQKALQHIKHTEIVFCAPNIFLRELKKTIRKVKLGAQNTYPGSVGAMTGEISTAMLALLGVEYVIVGHSERRNLGESNDFINQKIKSLLAVGINPILCVGERQRDPEHSYLGFIKTELEDCLHGIAKNVLDKIVIAYEPIWAIGDKADRPATPAEYLEMSIFIRKVLADKFGAKNIEKTRIVYGGSTTSENAYAFLFEGEADGFLVGRDSLDVTKFIAIVNQAEKCKVSKK